MKILKLLLFFTILLPASLLASQSDSVIVKVTVISAPVVTERVYVYFNGQRVAMEENGKKSFFHNDHLGGTNIITDESGQQVKYIDYQPYGATKAEEGTLAVKKKFTGKELDKETELYDYGARQYDPKIARFISADTMDPKLENPQSLNRYSYCLNNPLKHVDPSGHEAVLAAVLSIPGVREAIIVSGYLIFKWSFEQLSRSIHSMPFINLSFRLPGFDRSANPPPIVESPSPADIKYNPEGISYASGMNTNVLKANKTVVIGENMPDRVIPFAKETGAEYYKPRNTKTNYTEDEMIKKNERWINNKIDQGYAIRDRGIDKNRVDQRSPFYEVEQKTVEKALSEGRLRDYKKILDK